MTVNFIIREIDTSKELRFLSDFLLSRALDYKNYEEWLFRKCIPEIESGYKKAIIAISDRRIIGDIIYQYHKELPRTRELKNLRIHPSYRGRDLGRFLLKQAETENRNSFDRIIADLRKTQNDMLLFMQWCGYIILYQDFLYDANLDLVILKEFLPKTD